MSSEKVRYGIGKGLVGSEETKRRLQKEEGTGSAFERYQGIRA